MTPLEIDDANLPGILFNIVDRISVSRKWQSRHTSPSGVLLKAFFSNTCKKFTAHIEAKISELYDSTSIKIEASLGPSLRLSSRSPQAIFKPILTYYNGGSRIICRRRDLIPVAVPGYSHQLSTGLQALTRTFDDFSAKHSDSASFDLPLFPYNGYDRDNELSSQNNLLLINSLVERVKSAYLDTSDFGFIYKALLSGDFRSYSPLDFDLYSLYHSRSPGEYYRRIRMFVPLIYTLFFLHMDNFFITMTNNVRELQLAETEPTSTTTDSATEDSSSDQE